jgi:hypothetical protein
MKKRVLVVSAGLVHPSLSARRHLEDIISAYGLIDHTTVHDVESLTRLDRDDFSGAVLYFHRRHISDRALGVLDRFVKGGGGLLAIHGASASFKKTPRYFDILGGRFVGHGKIEPYTVFRIGGDDPLFSVTEPFAVIDELYIHRYDSDVTVHYATERTGRTEPVVWTKAYGEGRVCYISLGHVSEVLKCREVRQIITDALSFIAGTRSEGKK